MNEVLEQKLWEQAFDIVSKTQKTPVPTVKDISSVFADLIVKECAEHLNGLGDDHACIELLQHFGVDQ